MSGVVLKGSFAVDGRAETSPRRVERYTLEQVSKIASDLWVFQARLDSGEASTTLPS